MASKNPRKKTRNLSDRVVAFIERYASAQHGISTHAVAIALVESPASVRTAAKLAVDAGFIVEELEWVDELNGSTWVYRTNMKGMS